jgi:CheY-like chemotaxis protein
MRLAINPNTPETSKNEKTERNVSFDNGSPEVLKMLRKGIEAAKSGNRNEARVLLIRVAEAEPTNETTWLWLASISEYPEELLVFLQNVLNINPENTRAIEWTKQTKSLLAKNVVQRGINASQENQKEIAKQCFLQAIAHDNQNEMAWLWLASVVESAEEKIAHLKKVLSLNPENETAISSLKIVKNQMAQAVLKKANQAVVVGDRETARNYLHEAMKHDNECEEVWLLKAHLADSFDEKVGYFTKVLSINSENESAKSGLLSVEAVMKSVIIQPKEKEQFHLEDKMESVSQTDIQHSIEESFDHESKVEETVYPAETVGLTVVEETVATKNNEENLPNEAEELQFQNQDSVEFNSNNEVTDFHNETVDLNNESVDLTTVAEANQTNDTQDSNEVICQNFDEYEDIHKTTEANKADYAELEMAETVSENNLEVTQPEVASEVTQAEVETDVEAEVETEETHAEKFEETTEETKELENSEPTEPAVSLEPEQAVETSEPKNNDDNLDDDNLLELHTEAEVHHEDSQKDLGNISFSNFNPEIGLTEIGSYSYTNLKPESLVRDASEYNFSNQTETLVQTETEDQTNQEFPEPAFESEVFSSVADVETKTEIESQEPVKLAEVQTEPERVEEMVVAEPIKLVKAVEVETTKVETIEQVVVKSETVSETKPETQYKICSFCSGANDFSADNCETCGAITKLFNVQAFLNNQDVDKEVMFDSIRQKELDKLSKDFTADDYQNLGLAYLNVHDLNNAHHNLDLACQLNPTNIELTSLFKGLAEKVERPAEKLVEKTPAEPEIVQEVEKLSHTILVVDDSPTVRKLISTKLERHGHTVVAAVDGMDALAKINEVVPDLILLDITMPRLDGYQVCKLIRNNELTKTTPVVMISGKDGFFDKVRGRMAGSTDFISKPFGPEILMKMLETHIH